MGCQPQECNWDTDSALPIVSPFINSYGFLVGKMNDMFALEIPKNS
jgi:hypothetical protein